MLGPVAHLVHGHPESHDTSELSQHGRICAGLYFACTAWALLLPSLPPPPSAEDRPHVNLMGSTLLTELHL